MKRFIYIILIFTVLLHWRCNINDSYELVSNDKLPFISYSVKLTAPLVNFDSIAYGIVEKQGQMWFVSFDTQGDIMYLNNVSDVFSGDFALDNITKLKYIKLGSYFVGIIKSSNDYHPMRLFYIDPGTGNLLDTLSPVINPDTSIISTKCVAVYPNDLNSASVFIFRQFKDTNNVFHQALIRYNCNASGFFPQDTILLDSLGDVNIFNHTVLYNDKLYFYLIKKYAANENIYEFEYSGQDVLNIQILNVHFLPLSYFPIDSNLVFTTTSDPLNELFPAVYSFKYHNVIITLPYSKFGDYLVTNGVRKQDTIYIIGFIYKDMKDINYAQYKQISGDYMMIRFSYSDFINSPTNTSFIYTELKDFKNFEPYGILDNGNGFTIIGKGDAFSYFPATIVLKTNYRGKPINLFSNAQH